MDLETLIIVVFCLVDDFVRDRCRGRGLRQRGPAPVLADSEVLTVEIVGEFLGLDTGRGLHAHFRRHFGHLFPGLREVHRTTFARQAANLWAAKHALWRRLAAMAGHDPGVTIVDSMPVPVCRFARAHRCRSLRDLSAFGHDPVVRLAGSLKLGHVHPYAAIRMLQVRDRPTALARTLGELGRVIKSLHLLGYIDDEGERGTSRSETTGTEAPP